MTSSIHFLFALLTLVVLITAGAQALLLAFQERALRRQNRLSSLFNFLPPIETMEKLLFRIIFLGFLLLTVLIITSIYFYYYQITLPLLQKIILAGIAWIIFAVLLMGRHYAGWRGRKAIYGTLIGVLLILFIYFGSVLLLNFVGGK